MNPDFIPTSFDSDSSNSAMYNINQPYMPGWDYPNQYDPYLKSYDHNFQNNFNSSQSSWGFTSPELNFQLPYPQFLFPDLDLYPPFPVPPNEEKSNLERSMEAMLESQQQIQNFLNSQSFPNQTLYTPFLEHLIEEE